MIAAILFYLFAAVLLGSAAAVVTARNPVHSVLFLILAFFNASALFLLAGAEFLAMVLIIVYVGAVAVLFLFVVMMLDVNLEQLRGGFQRYLPVGLAVVAVLLVELAVVLGGWKFAPQAAAVRLAPAAANVSNTAQLGQMLYTDFIFLFQASGLVLLVAMIGAIVLTLRPHNRARRQVIADQIARDPAQALATMDIPSRAGVAQLGIRRPLPAGETAEPAQAPHAGGHH